MSKVEAKIVELNKIELIENVKSAQFKKIAITI